MTNALLLIAVAWLAWSNGANDNFKGVATLYGSGACGFRPALLWATVATVGGSLLSMVLAGTLAATFSGKGLAPDEVVSGGTFALSVAAAAAATIFAATMLGMPTSTTHALTGGLAGAAIATGSVGPALSVLAASVIAPLLLSPLLAIAVTGVVYPACSVLRRSLKIEADTCLCVGEPEASSVAIDAGGEAIAVMAPRAAPRVEVARSAQCSRRYGGRVIGVEARTAVDAVHWTSAAAVCFARAVNDTPKIAAILLAGGGAMSPWILPGAGALMALGGLVNARRVAETMSRRVADMNTGQGVAANLVTSGLVLGGSSLGLPVSTTHVSCASIFGIGIINGTARWRTIAEILAVWVTTVPIAAVLGGGFFLAITRAGGAP